MRPGIFVLRGAHKKLYLYAEIVVLLTVFRIAAARLRIYGNRVSTIRKSCQCKKVQEGTPGRIREIKTGDYIVSVTEISEHKLDEIGALKVVVQNAIRENSNDSPAIKGPDMDKPVGLMWK